MACRFDVFLGQPCRRRDGVVSSPARGGGSRGACASRASLSHVCSDCFFYAKATSMRMRRVETSGGSSAAACSLVLVSAPCIAEHLTTMLPAICLTPWRTRHQGRVRLHPNPRGAQLSCTASLFDLIHILVIFFSLLLCSLLVSHSVTQVTAHHRPGGIY